MSSVPQNLKYTRSHEWISVDNGIAIVGITEHAQDLLGELVFVELPSVGSNLNQNQEVAVVESVKAASDVYMPVSGEIIEVNHELESAPEKVNQSPYQNGWLFKLKITQPDELETLLDAEAYQIIIESEQH